MPLRPSRFLVVKPICNAVFYLRFWYYAKLRRRLKVHNDESGVLAHKYSIERVGMGKTGERIVRIIRALVSIQKVGPDSRVLAVGCRNEQDMLYLVGYGLKAENVRGLDMISYSPWIDVGNMHSTNYPDSSWDVVLMGWVLPYSDDPKRAAREMVRITKPGGLIAIAHTYYKPDKLAEMHSQGVFATGPERLQTAERVLGLFSENVDHVYFNHDPDPDEKRQGACMVIFSVRK